MCFVAKKVVRVVAQLMAQVSAEIIEDRPVILSKTREVYCQLFNMDESAWIQRLLRHVAKEDLYPFLKWTDPRPELRASDYTCLDQATIFRRHILKFLRGCNAISVSAHSFAALTASELTSAENRRAFSYVQSYSLIGWPCVVMRAGRSNQGFHGGTEHHRTLARKYCVSDREQNRKKFGRMATTTPSI